MLTKEYVCFMSVSRLNVTCVSMYYSLLIPNIIDSEENFRPYWNPIYAWVYSDVRCQPYYLQHTDRYFCTDDGVVVCLSKDIAFIMF